MATGRWRVLLRDLGGGRGQELSFEAAPEWSAWVEGVGEGGECELATSTGTSAAAVLDRVGRMPLPPYIKRGKQSDARDESDRRRYQTVFAHEPGAVAAPTAALHFSEKLLRELREAGIHSTFVTLNVGLGTFKPVTVERLDDHPMHSESYTISAEAAEALNRAKQEGRRIVAVGTTSARVLESQPAGEPFAPRAPRRESSSAPATRGSTSGR